MAEKYSLGNYSLAEGYDPFNTPQSGSFLDSSGLGFNLLSGNNEGSSFMDGLDLGVDTDINANLGLLNNTETGLLNNTETGGGFLEGLNFGNISKGVGLASSMYSDYMQNKYLNAAMDTMDANLAMAQKADDTHYKNAAGFDNYSSSRTA